SLAGCDLFLNVAGGWKIVDTGADLALVSAILSGALDVPVPSGFTCFGEVGLGGEVRTVQMPLQRVREAVRMGFTKVAVPHSCAPEIEELSPEIEVVPVKDVASLKTLLSPAKG
ncbi:MAG: DNA repair protein RadA, partial [Deltaproteobacteria bacterium]